MSKPYEIHMKLNIHIMFKFDYYYWNRKNNHTNINMCTQISLNWITHNRENHFLKGRKTSSVPLYAMVTSLYKYFLWNVLVCCTKNWKILGSARVRSSSRYILCCRYRSTAHKVEDFPQTACIVTVYILYKTSNICTNRECVVILFRAILQRFEPPYK